MMMTTKPPREVLEEAWRRSRALGRALYVYRGPEGWHATRRLAAVPAGAPTWEVRPQLDHPERHNTGGC